MGQIKLLWFKLPTIFIVTVRSNVMSTWSTKQHATWQLVYWQLIMNFFVKLFDETIFWQCAQLTKCHFDKVTFRRNGSLDKVSFNEVSFDKVSHTEWYIYPGCYLKNPIGPWDKSCKESVMLMLTSKSLGIPTKIYLSTPLRLRGIKKELKRMYLTISSGNLARWFSSSTGWSSVVITVTKTLPFGFLNNEPCSNPFHPSSWKQKIWDHLVCFKMGCEWAFNEVCTVVVLTVHVLQGECHFSPKFSQYDIIVSKNIAHQPVYRFCESIYIFWTHLSVVNQHCTTFLCSDITVDLQIV